MLVWLWTVLFGQKKVFAGVKVLRYPCGPISLGDGCEMSCKDYARKLLDEAAKTGELLLPSNRDECGNWLWDFDVIGGNCRQVRVSRLQGVSPVSAGVSNGLYSEESLTGGQS